MKRKSLVEEVVDEIRNDPETFKILGTDKAQRCGYCNLPLEDNKCKNNCN